MSQVKPPYRFADNATSSTSNDYGNYILKRGMGEIRKPSWDRTETVIRILPQWNFEENTWEPFRRSTAPMDFGDWIRRYEAVRGFGDPGVTLLLYDPVENPSYNLQENPCVLLHRAISSAIDNGQCEADWPALFRSGPGRRAALGRHAPIYLLRCGIFRIKSKDLTVDRAPLGLAGSDPAYFMELPKSAGEKLIFLMEDREIDPKGDPNDFNAIYKCGDVVSLKHGKYLHIFEDGADPRANAASNNMAAPRQISVAVGRGGFGGGGKTSFKGYDLYFSDTFNGFAANMDSDELEPIIRAKQRPWEDCLNFLSNREQAFLVQDGFPAKAIAYAWRDHPDWIKDETRSRAVGRVSASMDPAVVYPGDRSPAVSGVSGVAAGRPSNDGARQVSGSWSGGTAAADKRDNIVPQSLPESNGTAEHASNSSAREQAAVAALAAAKARAGVAS